MPLLTVRSWNDLGETGRASGCEVSEAARNPVLDRPRRPLRGTSRVHLRLAAFAATLGLVAAASAGAAPNRGGESAECGMWLRLWPFIHHGPLRLKAESRRFQVKSRVQRL